MRLSVTIDPKHVFRIHRLPRYHQVLIETDDILTVSTSRRQNLIDKLSGWILSERLHEMASNPAIAKPCRVPLADDVQQRHARPELAGDLHRIDVRPCGH